jgi:hypothetical protein
MVPNLVLALAVWHSVSAHSDFFTKRTAFLCILLSLRIKSLCPGSQMLAAYLRCGLIKAKKHVSFTFSSEYLPTTRLKNPNFFNAVLQMLRTFFPHDMSAVYVIPRYFTSSDIFMLIPLTVYACCSSNGF